MVLQEGQQCRGRLSPGGTAVWTSCPQDEQNRMRYFSRGALNGPSVQRGVAVRSHDQWIVRRIREMDRAGLETGDARRDAPAICIPSEHAL
jgi:hypothetical protein